MANAASHLHTTQIVRPARWGMVVLAILSILGGILFLSDVYFASLVSATFLGAILMIDGVIFLVHASRNTRWREVIGHAIIGILWILAGVSMWIFPGAGLVSLTLLITVLLIISGFSRISFAVSLQPARRGWTLFSGILSLFLAALIIMHWPMSLIFIPGLFLGIDLIVYGISLLSLASFSPSTNMSR
ncbi:MAG: acid-resistance rane protein [Bacteriovoracaceae bacterium]|nr:acid-resistance rane protein [Bacteriovoracaceae bacterium]